MFLVVDFYVHNKHGFAVRGEFERLMDAKLFCDIYFEKYALRKKKLAVYIDDTDTFTMVYHRIKEIVNNEK